VLCGQPNVGKSSLVNAIVGFQRAIVHDVPGTTRDVVSQSTAIAGWPVSLRDTAGLRESEDLIESKGIEKAKTEIEFADVVVCVFDGSRSWTAEDQAILDSIQPHLVVGNKIDRVASSPSNMPKASDFLKTSATTGQGVENLIAKIANVMVPDSPSKDQAFPVAPDQISELEAMRTSTENL
jgi:tRNA modification GTPase